MPRRLPTLANGSFHAMGATHSAQIAMQPTQRVCMRVSGVTCRRILNRTDELHALGHANIKTMQRSPTSAIYTSIVSNQAALPRQEDHNMLQVVLRV